MARYGIAVDSHRCMACYNCFMACKDEHCGFDNQPIAAAQPHMGHFWMNLKEYERGNDSRRIKTATIQTLCLHCQKPACGKPAQNGAVYKRTDGIVIIDPAKSKGQKKIVDACPIGAIFWNEELQIPQKCTMCAHLLDKDYKEPRCVEACPNQALIFGDLDDPNSEVSKKIAKGKATPLKGMEGVKSNVVHLNVPTLFLAGTVYLPEDEVAIGAKVTLKSSKGNIITGETNDFGDYEFEGLDKDEIYEIKIDLKGYKTVILSAKTDINRFVGDTLMEPSK
jgi:Fe-S-cluster-containing dehydrogenase component